MSPAPTPAVPAPMLAVAGPLPRGPGWVAEVKWDGIRLLVDVPADGAARCRTRTGRDVSGTWPEVAGRPPEGLRGRAAVLDGEVVALDGTGRPSFGLLQQRMGLTAAVDVRAAAGLVPAVFMVFDLLALDGHDLTARPWHRRRALLDGLDLAPWQVPVVSPDPAALLAFTAEHGLEGVVAKRRDSPYAAGARSPDWVKVKHVHTQEVVVGGWLPGRGARAGELGSLLAGIPVPGIPVPGISVPGAPGRTGDSPTLRFVGRVGTGFGAAARAQLLALLGPLATTRSPFDGRVVAPGARWVRPELVGEVVAAERTVNGLLRHPAWRGLRPDKLPADVVGELGGR